MPILIFSISVISFILFTIIHSLYPKNPISPYLIPRFLGDGQFSKSALRQTGTSWIVFSLWLLSITFTLPYLFPKGWLDGNFWIVGLFAFVIPVISIMLLIAGIYYICIGIFSRKEMITPALKTDRVIDPELREVYIKRLIRITKINLISLVLFIGVPIIEAILDVEANGYVALVNISFLITFIFFIWPHSRIRRKISPCPGKTRRGFSQI